MTKAELLDQIGDHPLYQMVANPELDKAKFITASVSGAIDRICQTAPDIFDFCQGRDTKTVVASTSDYNLTGSDDDCAEVLSIRYGTELLLLEHLRQADYERKKTAGYWFGSPSAWMDAGRKNQAPMITMIGTPEEDSSFEYRYRRNNLTIEEFPNDWYWVLVKVTLAELVAMFKDKNGRVIQSNMPSEAAGAIMFMVSNYRRYPENKNWQMPADPVTANRNNKRNRLYGYQC